MAVPCRVINVSIGFLWMRRAFNHLYRVRLVAIVTGWVHHTCVLQRKEVFSNLTANTISIDSVIINQILLNCNALYISLYHLMNFKACLLLGLLVHKVHQLWSRIQGQNRWVEHRQLPQSGQQRSTDWRGHSQQWRQCGVHPYHCSRHGHQPHWTPTHTERGEVTIMNIYIQPLHEKTTREDSTIDS